MKTAQTVITAGLLKPDIASAGVTSETRYRLGRGDQADQGQGGQHQQGHHIYS
jgi:hypothetical protein